MKPIILYNDQMLMKFKRQVLVRRGAGEGEDRLARKQSLPIITDKMDHACPVSYWTYSTWLWQPDLRINCHINSLWGLHTPASSAKQQTQLPELVFLLLKLFNRVLHRFSLMRHGTCLSGSFWSLEGHGGFLLDVTLIILPAHIQLGQINWYLYIFVSSPRVILLWRLLCFSSFDI